MFSAIFHAILYDPLYNGLVFFINVVPYADVGLAVIAITLVVRIVLFPLFSKNIKIQAKLKKIEPELKKLKEQYKEDRQTQAHKTMEIYRRENINPFVSILTFFVQVPIFLALYFIFLRGGLPEIDPSLMYSFVTEPSTVNMHFLGLIDLAGRSFILAGLAGASQFVYMKVSPAGNVKPRSENPSMKEDLTRSMQLQMKFGLPVIVAMISYFISAAVALYWTTNNLFGIFQELFIRRRMERDEANTADEASNSNTEAPASSQASPEAGSASA